MGEVGGGVVLIELRAGVVFPCRHSPSRPRLRTYLATHAGDVTGSMVRARPRGSSAGWVLGFFNFLKCCNLRKLDRNAENPLPAATRRAGGALLWLALISGTSLNGGLAVATILRDARGPKP